MAGRASYSVNSREASPSGSCRSPTFAPTLWAHFTPFAACLSHACHYSFSTRCARPLFSLFGAFPSLASPSDKHGTGDGFVWSRPLFCQRKTTIVKARPKNVNLTYIMHEILQVIRGCDQTIRQQRHSQPGFHRLHFLVSALRRNRRAKVSWLV
jgi:hypothetical protein